MKITFTLLMPLFCFFSATSQTAVIAVDTSSFPAAKSFTYTAGGNTYNWGVSPNDSVQTLFSFIAGSKAYVYLSNLPGSVKLRRVNNSITTGNYTVEWAQAITSGTTFNMFPAYQKSMDTFLTGNTYNKGTDNLFDNTSGNSNNIERLDWILTAGYATPMPDKAGVVVFDKGTTGTHDPFCMAAITSVDSLGNPLTYGKILRVSAADYGDPGPSIAYRIVKGQYPADLITAGSNTQNIGGVFITFEEMGIAADTKIFGYSLFSNDLPGAATPANLINYNDAVYFPLNTGNDGGLDLVAVTGFNLALSEILPVTFLSFNAVDNNNSINLKWVVDNETSLQHYDVERSADGIHFTKVNAINSSGTTHASYSIFDNVSSVVSQQLYYRIKQYEADGSFHYSKIVLLKRNTKGFSILLYPNPVQHDLYLNIAGNFNDQAEISIFNSAGIKVLYLRESIARGNNSFTIDATGNLSKDIYQLIIRFKNSGRVISKRFVKQ